MANARRSLEGSVLQGGALERGIRVEFHNAQQVCCFPHYHKQHIRFEKSQRIAHVKMSVQSTSCMLSSIVVHFSIT